MRLLCLTHRVRLILHGHVHLSEDRRVGGVRIIGTCASTEPIPLGGSRRTGLKPVPNPRIARSGSVYQFHRYTIHGDGARVTRRVCTVGV